MFKVLLYLFLRHILFCNVFVNLSFFVLILSFFVFVFLYLSFLCFVGLSSIYFLGFFGFSLFYASEP